jgi:solute carrier family 25 protein 42
MIPSSNILATSTLDDHATDSPPSPPEESLLTHFLASSSSLQFSNTLICGALAGIAAKTVIAPLERIKMTFQVSTDRFTLQAAIQRGILTARREGVLSLWKGHSTTVLRVAPYAALSYTFHDLAELFFRQLTDSRDKPLPGYLKFAAGSIGGLAGTLLTYPLDVLRVRIALGGSWASSVQQGGLFHGLLPTLLGIAPYAGTAWLVKQTLLEAYTHYYPQHPPSIPESLAINAIAGLMGQFVTYPLDILRRRMQIARPMEVVQMIHIVGAQHVDARTTQEYAGTTGTFPSSSTTKASTAAATTMATTKATTAAATTPTSSASAVNIPSSTNKYLSMTEMLKQLVREEGIRGLGKGFTLNIIKGPISLSVSLTVYDWLRSHIFSDETQQQQQQQSPSKHRPRDSTATSSSSSPSSSTSSSTAPSVSTSHDHDGDADDRNGNGGGRSCNRTSSNRTSTMTETTSGRRGTMVGGASYLATTAEELSNQKKLAKQAAQ